MLNEFKMTKLYLVVIFTINLIILGSAFKCPIGLGRFSSDTDNQYYQCHFGRDAKLTECSKEELYVPKYGKCTKALLKRNPRDARSDIEYLSNVPILGRSVNLGDLYDAKEDRVMNGENFWTQKTIETQRRYAIRNGFSSNIFEGRTIVDRLEKMKISKPTSISYLAGLVKVDGSANFLLSDVPKTNEESVTYEYKMTSHAYTLNNNARMDNNKYCGNELIATHFITSITYGRNLLLNLKRIVKPGETKKVVNKKLYDLIKQLPSLVQMETPVLTSEDEQFTKNMTVGLYGDFEIKTDSMSYLDAVKALKEVAKKKLSTPVKMELAPITKICDKSENILIELSEPVIQAVMNTLRNFEVFMSKIKAFMDNETMQKIENKERRMQFLYLTIAARYTDFKRQIRNFLPEIRAGKVGEGHLVRAIQDDNLWPYTEERFNALHNNLFKVVRMVEQIQNMFNQTETPNVDIEFKNGDNIDAYSKYSSFILFKINLLPNQKSLNDFFDAYHQYQGLEFWYKNKKHIYSLSRKLKEFKDFVKTNEDQTFKHQHNTGYVLQFTEYKDEPFQIQAVDGRREKDFVLPNVVPMRKIVSVDTDSVTFSVRDPRRDAPYIKGYAFKYWTGDNKEKAIQNGPWTFDSREKTITNLKPLTEYQFEVFYSTDYGFSNGGDTVDKVITKAVSPPTEVRETGKTNTEVSVSWNQPTMIKDNLYVSHYNVAAFRNGQWVHQLAVNGLQATFADLRGHTEYYFRITAVVRTRDLKEHYSNPATLRVITCPDPPRNLLALNVTSNSVFLTWNAPMLISEPKGVDYVLRYAEASDNGTVTPDTVGYMQVVNNITEAVIYGLKENQYYMIRAQVRLSDCQSGFSNVFFKTRERQRPKNDTMKLRMNHMEMRLTNQSDRLNSTLDKMMDTIKEVHRMFEKTMQATELKLNKELMEKTKSMMEKQNEMLKSGFEDMTQRSTGCKWQTGDGISQTELLLYGSFQTKWDCYRACLNRKKYVPKHKNINGATHGKTNGRCYCEKKMQAIRTRSTKYLSCRFAPPS